MRSSHSKFYLKRWHKIGLRTILFTLDHSVVAWEQGGRWPLHWPGRGHGHRIPAGWHSSGPRCQQERGHTRMSKSERRNCWNYTFNFHQAASTSGGGAVGQCHLGHRTPGTQGCLLLCNGQQDTSHLNWCIIKHNFQLFLPQGKEQQHHYKIWPSSLPKKWENVRASTPTNGGKWYDNTATMSLNGFQQAEIR